jgi:hypothetical protein
VSVKFYPRSASTIALARRSGMGGPAGVVLSTMPGRLAWAGYLRRRVPAQTARLHLSAWRERRPAAWTTISPTSERAFRGAALVVVGPGERNQLLELIESIRHYEGSAIKVVVADDATGEYPDSLVASLFPEVDFVRARVPGGNASCSFRTQQLGFLHLLAHYDVPAILKVDPDSLVIGSGAFELARARFDADPTLGELGTTEVDASGARTDYGFSSWVAHEELRWSARWRRLYRLASMRVGELQFAQGGAYFLAPRALAAARTQRLLPFRQPSWSLLTEDFTTGLVVQAAGFRVGSFGAPGDAIASNTRILPLEPAAALEQGVKVIHSVRGTPSGRTETEVREFFRCQRAESAAGPPRPAPDPA